MIESVICLPLVILHRWIDVLVSRHIFFIESLICVSMVNLNGMSSC